jgi:hypothetical protein
MLTENQLNVKHNIYWFENEQMYRRIIGGVSEFGYRTNDIFGDNIYVNPERFIPSRGTNINGSYIYQKVEGKTCICGCDKCKNLFVMCHIESNKEIAVGSSCITKAKGHLYKKYNDTDDNEIKNIKKEYDQFDNYLKDKDKIRCFTCYTLVYAKSRKPNKKNITAKDYCDTENPPYCYKCDIKYINNTKCLNCNDRIVQDINKTTIMYNDKFCEECSNIELKFQLDIKYDEKDEYKKRYKIKWDNNIKKWYIITTLEKINHNLILKIQKSLKSY